jgi:hypothetical protein
MQLETRTEHIELEDLVLRHGRPDDLEQVVALNVEHNGPDTEPMIRALWDDPFVGPGLFTVIADGDRVVSTLVLWADELRLRDVAIPVGRPEFVVSSPEYRGRGLVRAQIDMVHRWSATRGDIVQMITGIPYFYRQFGYAYATKPCEHLVIDPSVSVDVPAGWTVRPAVHDDVADMVAMQEQAQERFELRIARSTERWHALLDVSIEPDLTRVAVGPDGRVRGTAQILPGQGPRSRPFLNRLAVSDPGAALVLAAHAHGDRGLGVDGRAGTLASRTLSPLARAVRSDWEPYFRIPDPVEFLRAIGPVLDARLAASPFSDASGELLVSFYRSSLTIAYREGRVTGVRSGGPEQNPLRREGAGIPPDMAATLLLGGCGVQALSERFRDVNLGGHGALMDVLFPEVEADFLLF